LAPQQRAWSRIVVTHVCDPPASIRVLPVYGGSTAWAGNAVTPIDASATTATTTARRIT
jgi:hypothetical protein